MIDFARLLPRLRKQVRKDMSDKSLTRNKVVATVITIMDKTQIRIGNSSYAKANGSYGVTTLSSRHLAMSGSKLRFRFVGKSGRTWQLTFTDRRVANIVGKLQELPGQQLFQYIDDEGARRDVRSDDVNAYLKTATGSDVTAKDFRTWVATVLAAVELWKAGPAASPTETKSNIRTAVKAVADKLGNTAAVCRKSYIHPAVLQRYENAALGRARFDLADARLLEKAERRVLTLLTRH